MAPLSAPREDEDVIGRPPPSPSQSSLSPQEERQTSAAGGAEAVDSSHHRDRSSDSVDNDEEFGRVDDDDSNHNNNNNNTKRGWWATHAVGNLGEPDFHDSSLYLLGPKNKFRRALWTLTESNVFQLVIVLAILGNCVFLALFRPLEPADSEWNHMLYIGEIVFLAIFLLEALLKILAHGFVVHKGSYLRSGWNRLDALIILSGIFGKKGGMEGGWETV